MQLFTAPRTLAFVVLLLSFFGLTGVGTACAVSASAKVAMPAEAVNARHLTLHIEGLKMPPGRSGIIEVYANRSDTSQKMLAQQANYVGYIALVPKNSLEIKRGISQNAVIVDISQIPASLKAAKEIMVSLVLGGKGPGENAPVEKKGTGEKETPESGLMWQRMYITAQ